MCVTQWMLGTGCSIVGVLLSATGGVTLASEIRLFKVTAAVAMVTGWLTLTAGIELIVRALP